MKDGGEGVQVRAILTLVRHGETSANIDGVWHGVTDTELTERGLAQAERVARFLHEHRGDATEIYSSHLRRARDTARVIGTALGREPRIDEDLREYDLGSWEGKTYTELLNEHRLWDQMRSDPDFAPHGGESPRQVALRCSEALRRIAVRHRGERVIVVAHGGALSLGLGALLEGDFSHWRVMDNCAVSEIVIEPTPELLAFNHVAHLDGL